MWFWYKKGHSDIEALVWRFTDFCSAIHDQDTKRKNFCAGLFLGEASNAGNAANFGIRVAFLRGPN